MSTRNLFAHTILLNALQWPIAQIAKNAGKRDGEIIYQIKEKFNNEKNPCPNAGYDALNDKIVDDMVVAGIVDPVKVARLALQNAVSAAGMFLTMEAAVTELPKKETSMPQMPPGGMGGMDY